jgi:GAF domain-containing protein/biotin carboxyl carrier protein
VSQSNLSVEHLQLLYEAGLEFSSTLDPDELLARVFDRALEVLDAEAGSIWLRKGDILVCQIARGPVRERIEGLELPMGAGIVGDVALRGEAELVADPSDDPRFVHQVDEATGFATRSLATTPLKTKDHVLGALQVLNKRSGAGMFDEADLALLEGLAATAGLALANAQMHDAERRARDLKAMLDISREITSTLDTDRLVISLVNLGSRILSYDRAAVSVDDGGQSILRAISGQETLDAKSDANRELVRLMEWLLERGEVAYVVDIQADTELASSIRSAFPGHLERTGVRSLCLVPLQDEEGRIGAFYMESGAVGFLGDSGLEAAQLLATQASVALRNAELYGQVPLIGLLAPVADRWRRMTSLGGTAFLRRVGIPAAIVIALFLIPWRERVSIHDAELIPGDRMPVRATVDGLLTDIRVDEGTTVSQGDVLALLRQDEFTIRIAQTEGELASARREAAAARAAADETRARMAEIRATELAENLAVFERQLARTRIRAPVDGTILTVRPHEMLGEYLDAGQTFVLMGRTDRLQLEGQVRQYDIERVQNGYPVRLKVAARPNHTFIGTVTQIAPAARSVLGADATVTIWADLDNGEGLLRPGLEARAKVVGARRPIGYIIARPLIRWINMTFWR